MKIAWNLNTNGVLVIEIKTHFVFTDDLPNHFDSIHGIDHTTFQFDIIDGIARKAGRLKVAHGARKKLDGTGENEPLFGAFHF